MATHTTHLNLTKPEVSEFGDVGVINGNMDTLDEEVFKRVKYVNGVSPDANGNVAVSEVAFARQIVTDDAQQSAGEFFFRTTGGTASLSDGPAKLVSIQGRMTHTGIVAENIQMTVTAVPREEGEEPITAELNRDTFVSYVASSGTTTLTYTDAWSENPSLYGITVTGTPVSGDEIAVVYQKEDRGLITMSDPDEFISTGWNLYNHTTGYARVKKYSESYGFLIGGTWTALQYSATVSGAKITITPVSGYFNIPGDGYLWVTGGNGTNTYILMTWSDWGDGYEGAWKAYTEYKVSLSAIMTNFQYGLMQVGGIYDEINFSAGKAISRIGRLEYSAENLEIARQSGRAWDADADYIYLEREQEMTYDITATGNYTANDHGLEIINGGTVAPYTQMLYGQNLVDKLRTDVVTKSQDIVNNFTSTATDKALSANAGRQLYNDIVKKLGYANNTSDNLDDYTATGMWTANTPTNAPTTSSGWWQGWTIRANNSANFIDQFAIRLDTNDFYHRKKSNTWSPWKKFALNDDIVPLTTSTLIPNGSDLDTYKTPGNYHTTGSAPTASLSHCPVSTGAIKLIVEPGVATGYVVQHLIVSGQPISYFRSSINASTFGAWNKLATEDFLSIAEQELVSGSTLTFTISVPSIVYSDRGDMYIVSGTTDRNIKEISHVYLEVTRNGNICTVKNNGTYGCRVMVRKL